MSHSDPYLPRRGTAILATPVRWAVSSALLVAATLAALRLYLTLSHRAPTAGLMVAAGIACSGEALMILALLRAEESRLARELRTARQGTALLRAMIRRRTRRGPLFARLVATELGGAALSLADGDESAARDMLAAELPWMHIGRVGALRAIVLADADRASGALAARSRCLEQLRTAPKLNHREADLYRLHVLVKATLEQGDAETALELASLLVRAKDDDERTYGTWLRVWFELDSEAQDDRWPPLAEQDARLASLLARSHGAEALVGKLEARLLAIARPAPQG